MLSFRSRVGAAILGVAAAFYAIQASAGTLLPNGQQTFLDQNGQPLAGGCVYFFVPGSSTPKDTYQDSAQTQLNANPVPLDAAGRAIIYGTGIYRQLVKSTPCGSLGVTIWDALTTDTSSSNTIFAGASAGTPNAITVTAAGFSGANGQIINYISTNTNTAAATLTVTGSGFSAIQIVRDLASGYAALSGGELVATNSVSLLYDATAAVFHILSPVTWPNTSGVPVGSVTPFAGFNPPDNYVFAFGQAVSRTVLPALLAVLTSPLTGSISSGSPTITGLPSTNAFGVAPTSQFGNGTPVEALGIPAGTTVISCTSTTCTMSANATLTRSGTMTFFAYGNGNGTTTFNLPDYRGVAMIGADNMGGTQAFVSQMTGTIDTTSGSPTAILQTVTGGNDCPIQCWAVGMTVISPNVPAGTTIASFSGVATPATLTLSANATATVAGSAVRLSMMPDAQMLLGRGGSKFKAPVLAETPTHFHNNTLTDTGHTHTITDPGHNHTQNAHNHGIGDSGHTHTITDPGHTHGTTNLVGSTVMTTAGGAEGFGAGAGAHNNTTAGFSINSASTGITGTNNNTTGITINNTTATNNATTTGITGVNNNTTGITINNGFAGGGVPFGLQPLSKNVNYIIRIFP